MKKFRLFRIGVTDEMDTELRRVTILTNVVYVLLFFLLTAYLVYYLPAYLRLERLTLRSSIAWLSWITIIVGLLLNKIKQHRLSKIVFMLAWISFMNIIPTLLGVGNPINLFVYPLYCLVSSVIIHLIFSRTREPGLYYSFTILIWLLTIFSYEFISYFNPEVDLLAAFPGGFLRWRIILLMIVVFINAAIMYVISVNQDFYEALQQRNDTISEQNKELEFQRKALEELKQDLEIKVLARTNRLVEQNNKLREYTFFNSHILRAPISRIRGLVNLLTLKIDQQEEKHVRKLLGESMDELDQAVKSINNKLETPDPEETESFK